MTQFLPTPSHHRNRCIFFMIITILFFSCKSRKIVIKNPEATPTHFICNCGPNGMIADSAIILSNKKSISLCGVKTYSAIGTSFKYLSYGECNKSPIVRLTSSNAYLPLVVKDTLHLLEMIQLPINPNYTYSSIAILQEKVWFYHDSLQSRSSINFNFPAYTHEQILDVFEQYQQMEVIYDKRVSILMDKLFVSAISGNVLAVKTFKNFEAKFTNLTGADKERYIELLAMLKKYLSLNK